MNETRNNFLIVLLILFFGLLIDNINFFFPMESEKVASFTVNMGALLV